MKKLNVNLINGITKVEKKHYDIIISNPPYGKIGNEITQCIVDNIDFGCFVNLLPANDYRRFHKENALWQYVDIRSMKTVQGGFSDAAVTTMMCKINKERAHYISEDEFEIENYIDPALKKYFYENRKRSHYAIDNFIYKPTFTQFDGITVEKSIYIGKRDVAHGHMPYSEESIATRYNKNKITKEQVIVESAKSEQALGRIGDLYLIVFKSEKEKDNFSNFMYSERGFDFVSKIFTAMHVDSSVPLDKVFPKVDWTRSWTPEQILKEYGYTDDEIKETLGE